MTTPSERERAFKEAQAESPKLDSIGRPLHWSGGQKLQNEKRELLAELPFNKRVQAIIGKLKMSDLRELALEFGYTPEK